ncbi:bacteriohemerythrin [Zoogloea sp.]|jgi:diguanylate cyclase (GGDEF)-like protein/hemerythrin-like metal-binding protein|uniref:bacteriohemerythrin n=1 Tax=Zoogloea sp. TaxID=49181 RepID=UPI0035B33E70
MHTVEIFPWNANLETGIAEIDVQHQQLVKLINRLAGHVAYETDLPGLEEIFNELTAYAEYHFATEEAIWREVMPEDPWEVEHRKTHQTFIAEVMRLRKAREGMSDDMAIDGVLSFLCQWLAFHILYNDRCMAQAVVAIRRGQEPEVAKRQSSDSMNTAVRALIETVLAMYERLSSRTMQLAKELATRKKLEAKLLLAGSVFDNTLESICIVDAAGNVIDANPAFCLSCERDKSVLLGMPLNALKSGLLDGENANEVWNAVSSTGHWSGTIQCRNPSGELSAEWLTLSAVRDANGDVGHYVAVFSSVGELIQRQNAMEHWAHHDALTGLPNRLLLKDRFDQAIAQASRDGSLLALCYLDLDDFKPINDHFGHAAGDHVLQVTAERILKELRATDTVARVGGDEFVILFNGVQHAGGQLTCIDRIIRAIRRPIPLDSPSDGESVHVSASFGISLYPLDGRTLEGLLHRADEALYRVKSTDKGSYQLYLAGGNGSPTVA